MGFKAGKRVKVHSYFITCFRVKHCLSLEKKGLGFCVVRSSLFVFFIALMPSPLSSLPMATGFSKLLLPSNKTLGRQTQGTNFHFFVRVSLLYVTIFHPLILTSNYYGYLRYTKEREGEIVTFGDGGRKVGGAVAAKTAGKTA